MVTNHLTKHIAGIIPVGHSSSSFNMPWHDSLMPVHSDYHAIERAVHTAAAASCDTIWVVLHREAQPIIKKKIGDWVYDPNHIWEPPNVFFNKKEIPVYFIAIHPKDRKRKDSQAWSAIYGARVAAAVCSKISTWTLPKRYLVVSPYGVCSEQTIKDSRLAIHGTQNVAFVKDGKTFLDNEHLPFTFSHEEYEACRKQFKEDYTGKDVNKTFGDIFKPVNLQNYTKLDIGWHYNISSWEGYSQLLGSPHNKECERPKHMVIHKWHGLVKDH